MAKTTVAKEKENPMLSSFQEAKKSSGYRLLTALEEDFLTVLLREPMYPMQLLRIVNTAKSSYISVGFGSLYPTLERLVQKGYLVYSVPDLAEGKVIGLAPNSRKLYAVTERGKSALLTTCSRRNILQEPVLMELLV